MSKKQGAVYDLEKEMAVEFKKAFATVAKQSMTIDEMLRSGLLYGARLDTKKIEAAAASKAAEGGDAPADGSGSKDSVDGAKKE